MILNIPLSPGKWAKVEMELPLEEVEHERLILVLKAMRPGMVKFK